MRTAIFSVPVRLELESTFAGRCHVYLAHLRSISLDWKHDTLLSVTEWHLSTAAHRTRVAKMLNKEKLVDYGKVQERNNKKKKATWTMMMMMMMMVKTGKWGNIVFFGLDVLNTRECYENFLARFHQFQGWNSARALSKHGACLK